MEEYLINMNTKSILLIVIILIMVSCSSWKSQLLKSGSIDNARMNAIIDFAYTMDLYKGDQFVIVRNREDSNDIYTFSLLSDFQIAALTKDTIGASSEYFPNRYIEVNNKLFLWVDKNAKITKEIVDILQKNNIIDSTYFMIEDGRLPSDYELIDNCIDSKKGVYYFICKNNPSKYKRIITSIIISKETYPEIECK